MHVLLYILAIALVLEPEGLVLDDLLLLCELSFGKLLF